MLSASRSAVLADLVFPRLGLARDVLLIIAFAGLTALSAQISVRLPFSPVPLTGQTLAVLLTGTVLGSRRGALSMASYVGAGAVGLPVFAGGGSGLFWQLASGGYLIGFVVAAFLVGWCVERGWDRGPWLPTAMLLGNAMIYVPGLLQLGFFVGWDDVLVLGLYPFVPGDLLKLFLASTAVPSAWAVVGRVRRP